jgi:hypothetical protein
MGLKGFISKEFKKNSSVKRKNIVGVRVGMY